MQLNTAMQNRIADSYGDAFDSGSAQVRTGARPGPNAAVTGTLLGTITLPADAYAAAVNGVAAKQGTWEDSAADATGTAGWIRLFSATATLWLDFQIGVDATMADAAVVAGNPIRIDTADITQPSGV